MSGRKSIVPHNAKVEEALLGCAVLGAYNDLCVQGVTRNWFNELLHKATWDMMESLEGEVSLESLCIAAKTNEPFKECGGSTLTLAGMADEAPFADNWTNWLPELQKHLRLREYQTFGMDVVRLANEADNVDDFADDLESRVMQLRKFRATKTTADRKASFERIERNLEEAHLGNGINGLPTGFDDLDRTLGGMRGGQLITIASRPGMGKTTVACNIARHIAVDCGIPVAFFSLEASDDEINAKMSAAMSDVNLHSFYSHKYTEEERVAAMARMAASNPKLYAAPIMIEPRSDITINGIRAQARRMVHRENVKLIIVDYLQLVGTKNGRGNRVVEVGQISRGLKSMAMEFQDVPVIALAQLNRQIENDGNRAPRLADLRESGSIEADSDVVAFIYCEDFSLSDEDRLLCQMMVAKNRAGRINEFDLCFQRSFNRFEDWRQHQDLVAKRELADEEPKKKGRKSF